MFWGAISNTRKSVSLDIQTLRSWLKNSAAPRFFKPLLSVRISDDILREKQNKLGKITVRYWYVFYCIIRYSDRAGKDAGYKPLATLVKHSACQIYQVECVMQLWYKNRYRRSRCRDFQCLEADKDHCTTSIEVCRAARGGIGFPSTRLSLIWSVLRNMDWLFVAKVWHLIRTRMNCCGHQAGARSH